MVDDQRPSGGGDRCLADAPESSRHVRTADRIRTVSRMSRSHMTVDDFKAEWRTAENIPYRVGAGEWEGFRLSNLTIEQVLQEAGSWAASFQEIERPWLCWNVDDDWCLVQQRLVREVGWTPIVGFDPRVGPPPLIPGAVLVDFNARLKLPTMWMHFPLEFIFCFCDRLAYWHADCLLRIEKMRRYAQMFAGLRDGEMAAVRPRGTWRERVFPTKRRYWEVLGCSTRGASRSQFENGCGWWMTFPAHVSNTAEQTAQRRIYHWECGVGIRFWAAKCGGVVQEIEAADIAEGHFTGIGRKDYRRASPQNFKRDLSKELSLNNDLRAACAKLEISHLLGAALPTRG